MQKIEKLEMSYVLVRLLDNIDDEIGEIFMEFYHLLFITD